MRRLLARGLSRSSVCAPRLALWRSTHSAARSTRWVGTNEWTRTGLSCSPFQTARFFASSPAARSQKLAPEPEVPQVPTDAHVEDLTAGDHPRASHTRAPTPALTPDWGAAFRDISPLFESVVKVFSVNSSPNYMLPWQNKGLREVTGSGFVISKRRILTNAHVVADENYVLVRKLGVPTKYTAKVCV